MRSERISPRIDRTMGRSPPVGKITRPIHGAVFPRTRLYRLIDRLRKRPILWVSGPPGCGKTTLISSYLSKRGDPCLWYQVDEGDQDIASFFYSMGVAVRRASPRTRRPLPVLTRDHVPALHTYTTGYFENLFRRLQRGSVVVLDNYQKVPSKSKLHEVIRDGLSMIPEGITCIVISRGDPPPPFARQRVHRMMEVIGWKELRLSTAETKGIVRQRGRGRRSAEEIRSLQDRSDGWAAGLVLLLDMPSDAPGTAQGLVDHTPGELFEYFAGEIFSGLGEEAKRFLLMTSFLPRMTPRMAERITGNRRSGTVLSYLNRNNYFTELRRYGEPVYEFHPLFREFLLSRAGELFPAKRVRQIRTRAGAILEESGRDEDAVTLIRKSGDWQRLVRIIRRQAPALVRQGRVGMLTEWITALPESLRATDPWLLYWRGVCRLQENLEESRGDFEESYRRFRRRVDPEGSFLALSGVIDAILYGSGSLKAVDSWFSALAELMKRRKAFPSPEIEGQVTCTAIKALSLRRPSTVDMDMWARRATDLARLTRDLPLKFSLLLYVAYFRFHGGNFQELGFLLESLRGLSRKPEISPLHRLSLCWIEAAFANMSGLHERCRTWVAEGIRIADSTGVRLMDFLLTGHGVLCSLHGGAMEEAREGLREMASRLPAAKPWEASFYHRLAAWEALNRGNQAQAFFHSDRCIAICGEVGNPWTEALARLQKAIVHHHAGEEKEASASLEAALRIGENSRMDFVRFAGLLTGAFFSLERGEEPSALDSLRAGLRLGREKGYSDIYLWRPGLLETVAAAALENGIETEYVRELVRINGLLPGRGALELEQWPWPLKIFTLGRFELRKGDRPLPSSRKAQRKPLLLLKTLIAMGGNGVPEGWISDRLWPDADGDFAHQSFHTTLSRLRRLLGDEEILILRDGRLTLDTRRCWVDAVAFESLLGKWDEACSTDSGFPTPGIGGILAKRAITLYGGAFLQGENSDSWLIEARERMRNRFLRAAVSLGGWLEAEGRWEEAIVCYRRGLEVDDLGEEYYRRQMVCLHRLGRVPEALAVYRRCRDILAATLGVPPSPETEAVAASLR